jgi:hypothetical protein
LLAIESDHAALSVFLNDRFSDFNILKIEEASLFFSLGNSDNDFNLISPFFD